MRNNVNLNIIDHHNHLSIWCLMLVDVCDDIDQDPWQSSNYYINTTPDGKQEIIDDATIIMGLPNQYFVQPIHKLSSIRPAKQYE